MKPYVQVAQSCLTLCIPMDCSPPGSPVQGIFHARILQKVAISYSRGSSDPGIEPASLVSPALAGGFFTTSTTLPVTKLYLLGHSYFLCVCVGGGTLSYIFMAISMSLASSLPFALSSIILKKISESQSTYHFTGSALNAVEEISFAFPGSQCFLWNCGYAKNQLPTAWQHMMRTSWICEVKLTHQCERHNLFTQCTRIYLHPIQARSFEPIKGTGRVRQVESMEWELRSGDLDPKHLNRDQLLTSCMLFNYLLNYSDPHIFLFIRWKLSILLLDWYNKIS